MKIKMTTNKKLEQIMLQKKEFESIPIFNKAGLSNILNPNFIRVFDTIVLANRDKDISVYTDNFDKACQIAGDKTGYEVSNNDILVNFFC